ncbi:MAG: sodium-dependent bicarbonate transport family permease [Candidatus Manganitrophaceae bacterium]
MAEFLQNSISNLLSPVVLFFALGWMARVLKSDLDLPEEMVRGMSYYLMASIGLKGGIELAHEGWTLKVLFACLGGAFLGLILPVVAFAILRYLGKLNVMDAASIAAHYGSVSAVTFLTASAFLTRQGYTFEGYTITMMAVMESPAIAMGLLLARFFDPAHGESENGTPIGEIVREALFNGSVVVLVGAMVIGAVTGEHGAEAVGPFFFTLFKGVLCLFLLHMGIEAARRFAEFRQVGLFLTGFGIVMPLVGGAIGITLAWILGFSVGGTVLVAILGASASYIAVPAAMHIALPQANPSYSMTLALGITFPFNVIIGIPLYLLVAHWIH